MSPAPEHLAPGPHAFSTSSGATLTYFVTGNGPHILVNVAPGWGAASVLYQNGWAYLAHAFTFVHLEVRGTRGSSFPEDLAAMSSWHMAEDVEALRAHLGLETIDLAGHSNGGCIALWTAIRFPARVHRLVLLDAQVYGTKAGDAATAAILAARPDRDAVSAYMDLVLGDTDEAFGAALRAFLPLYLANPARDLDAFKAAFTNTPQVACIKTQGAAEAQHGDQEAQLGAITARTLVVVGRDDFITPVPVSELIARRVKGATLRIIEDCGHVPWIEQKNEFARILQEFFA